MTIFGTTTITLNKATVIMALTEYFNAHDMGGLLHGKHEIVDINLVQYTDGDFSIKIAEPKQAPESTAP